MTIGFHSPPEVWDRAYSNRGAVSNVASWMADAAQKARDFAASGAACNRRLIAYGSRSRCDIDVFEPNEAAKGTLIFIHGGYWRAGLKEEHHHFAGGALASGWRVAMPEYPLCPEVRVSDISALMVQAVDTIAALYPDQPVILSGHSAGGQLATYVASELSGLSVAARNSIGRVVSLSGVHDLRPLLFTRDLQGSLRLNDHEADAFSPVLRRPGHEFDLICVCGSEELPEFRRQNMALANLWHGFGLATRAEECAGRNHFTLLDLMCEPDSVLTRILTGYEPTNREGIGKCGKP